MNCERVASDLGTPASKPYAAIESNSAPPSAFAASFVQPAIEHEAGNNAGADRHVIKTSAKRTRATSRQPRGPL